MTTLETDDQLRDVLERAKTVAIIGMSNRPDRPSFEVGEYLAKQGYRILPVNPTIDQVLGLPVFKSLRDVQEHVDVVDVFRKPEDVPAVVDDAIAIGADIVWMQLGIVSNEAAAQARGAGLQVVMDRCMRKEHIRLLGPAAAGDLATP